MGAGLGQSVPSWVKQGVGLGLVNYYTLHIVLPVIFDKAVFNSRTSIIQYQYNSPTETCNGHIFKRDVN